MYPHERSLVKNLSGKPFAIIGVNSDDTIETPQKLVSEGTVTWRSFQNEGPEIPISESWGVTGWPTIYVLDGGGRIRYKNVRGPALDAALQSLLEEMGEEWPEFVHDEETSKFPQKATEAKNSDDGDQPEQRIP